MCLCVVIPYIYIIYIYYLLYYFLWRCSPTRAMASSFLRFLDHTQRRTTVGRTPLDEWSARRRDLYLTTHNTHNRQTSMPQAGFEHRRSQQRRAAADRRLRPRGHWDRHVISWHSQGHARERNVPSFESFFFLLAGAQLNCFKTILDLHKNWH